MPFETFIVVGQMSRSDGLDKLFLDNLLVPIGRVICKPLSRRIAESSRELRGLRQAFFPIFSDFSHLGPLFKKLGPLFKKTLKILKNAYL